MGNKSFKEFLNVAFPAQNPFSRNDLGTVTNAIKYIAVRVSFVLYRLGIKANHLSLFSALLSIPSFILIYQGTLLDQNVIKFLFGFILMGTVLFIDFVDGPLSKMNDYIYKTGAEIDNLQGDLVIMGSYLVFGMLSNSIIFTALFWATALFVFTYLRYTVKYIPTNREWLLKALNSKFSILSVRVFVMAIFPASCILYIYNQELSTILIKSIILFCFISCTFWIKATIEVKSKKD